MPDIKRTVPTSADETQSLAASDSDPRFFQAELKFIPESIAELFENYSGIPRDSQREHILRLRNEAYKSQPYPCLGRFRFLELDLSSHPLYDTYVLPTMTRESASSASSTVFKSDGTGPVFLDLGTCLGQDIRKLAYDGVSPTQLFGADIVSEYIDLGYSLFRDEDRLPRDHFLVPADIFANGPSQLDRLSDTVDILHVTAVFHLFDLERQKAVADRCLKLLRKNSSSRVLVLGGQAANVTPADSIRRDGERKYRHNEESWRRMWEEVCAGREWEGKIRTLQVNASLEDRNLESQSPFEIDGSVRPKVIGRAEDGFRWMMFSVWVEFA